MKQTQSLLIELWILKLKRRREQKKGEQNQHQDLVSTRALDDVNIYKK